MFSGFLYVKNENKIIKYIQSLIVQYSSNTWYVEIFIFLTMFMFCSLIFSSNRVGWQRSACSLTTKFNSKGNQLQLTELAANRQNQHCELTTEIKQTKEVGNTFARIFPCSAHYLNNNITCIVLLGYIEWKESWKTSACCDF